VRDGFGASAGLGDDRQQSILFTGSGVERRLKLDDALPGALQGLDGGAG
jgi:hypothetical protein